MVHFSAHEMRHDLGGQGRASRSRCRTDPAEGGSGRPTRAAGEPASRGEALGAHDRSPAAFAPLVDVGALGAERGVVAVAGVEPGLVGSASKRRVETSPNSCWKRSGSPWVLPTPPGKSESPVNRWGWPVPSSYTRQIEPGCARRRGSRRGAGADRDGVALADTVVDRHAGLLGDRRRRRARRRPRSRRWRDDLGEGPVVVPVLVGGDDGGQAAVADQLEQAGASSAASISTWSPVSVQRSR